MPRGAHFFCECPTGLWTGLPEHHRVPSGDLCTTRDKHEPRTSTRARPVRLEALSTLSADQIALFCRPNTGAGFGFATASFSQHAASRRRAVVQFVPEPSTRPPAHVPMCARSAGSRWVPQSKRSLHCSARSHCPLRHCATAAKHVWTSRTALLRCSRLAARSRPTTRSTRGSWRGLTHDLCYPSAGPAAVSQRASFLAPSC